MCTAAKQSIDTSPATLVIRFRDYVRGCSVMTHDGRSCPLGPSTRTRFGHSRSVVVIGNTMTRVVTASNYPADKMISTERRSLRSPPWTGSSAARATTPGARSAVVTKRRPVRCAPSLRSPQRDSTSALLDAAIADFSRWRCHRLSSASARCARCAPSVSPSRRLAP